MTKRLLTPLMLSAALALASCGGSSSSSDAKTFVPKLNALCNRANAAFAAASAQSQPSVIGRYLQRFHALKPPAYQSYLYSEYLKALQLELNDLKQGKTNDMARLAVREARPLALFLGANDCANPK